MCCDFCPLVILDVRLIAQLVRIRLQCRRPRFDSWVGKIRWRRDRLPTPVFLGFPCGSAGKESTCSAGDLGSIPGLGRSPGEGKGYPLQYSGLENSVDWIDHGVTKSRTRLSDFPFHSYLPLPSAFLLKTDFRNSTPVYNIASMGNMALVYCCPGMNSMVYLVSS